ncbi:glycine cleavage system protein h [Stylonychia lemnae]|uniref:Glycine cleavage system H protein n=1 Tax=Stylonychia lemnae TaxID=5949 RepID=A0A078B2Q4_STYLE|nr:glycine cleavage system protein h [Stylonychia lemnae]|eukprot:CDW88815.1 glycine cleavage system protein h [Stylonychia lemnae]
MQTGKIGITKYAQGELGDIVHVDIKSVGHQFKKGEGITAIESVKTAADVYAPVTGEVIAHNDSVKGEPALVNTDAETDGWLVQIKINDEKDLNDLMDAAAYEKFLEEHKH